MAGRTQEHWFSLCGDITRDGNGHIYSLLPGKTQLYMLRSDEWPAVFGPNIRGVLQGEGPRRLRFPGYLTYSYHKRESLSSKHVKTFLLVSISQRFYETIPLALPVASYKAVY